MSQSMTELSWAGLIPAGLLVVLGLLLWTAGRRVLRLVMAAVGFFLGAGLGWMAAAALVPADISPELGGWVAAATAGLLFACIGALAYRLAIAGALALVLAVAGPTAIVVADETLGPFGAPAAAAPGAGAATDTDGETDAGTGADAGLGTLIDDANAWLFERADRAGGGAAAPADGVGTGPDDGTGPGAGEPNALDLSTLAGPLAEQLGVSEGTAQKIQDARDGADEVARAGRAWWEETPERLRPVLVAALLSGALCGLLAATFAPATSATIVTSFGGALVWMTSLGVLMHRFGLPIEQWLSGSATVWLAAWLIISVLGLAIQWTTRPRSADTTP